MQGRVLPEATRIFVAFLAEELKRLDPQGA
jgi:hypothetical protein